eukprot:COSAG01_NODE_4794_length_4740_cov_1.812756_7_plen_41_part_00
MRISHRGNTQDMILLFMLWQEMVEEHGRELLLYFSDFLKQ